jgi:hypothetical protein
MAQSLSRVTFDGNALNDVIGADLYNHNFNDYPDKNINIHKLARKSLSIITSAEFTKKNIQVFMDICAENRGETEKIISRVKSILVQQNGLLEVMNAGLLMQWRATLNSFNIKWDGANARCELGFIASTPIGVSAEEFILFQQAGLVTSNGTLTSFIEGSYTVEPVITLRFNAISGSGDFSVYNAKTNQGVTISTPVVAGDYWVIDSEKKEVTQNSITRDFNGLYPTWDTGTQSFGYNDTYTSRNVDVQVKYRIRVA